jgi:Domain of unknown function (DUF6378)
MYSIEAQSIEGLLADRGRTHGSFASNAQLSQHMKELFRSSPNWSALTDTHKEALDVIALKLSRILSGQAEFADHWLDIQGYAALALKELE